MSLEDYAAKVISAVNYPAQSMGLFPTIAKPSTEVAFVGDRAQKLGIIFAPGDLLDCVDIGRRCIDYVVGDAGTPPYVALGVRDTERIGPDGTRLGANQDFNLIFPYSVHVVKRLEQLQSGTLLNSDERLKLSEIIQEYGGVTFDATCWYRSVNPAHVITYIEPGIFSNSPDAAKSHPSIAYSLQKRKDAISLPRYIAHLPLHSAVLAFTEQFRPRGSTLGDVGFVTLYISYQGITSFNAQDYAYNLGFHLSVKYPNATISSRFNNPHDFIIMVKSQKQLIDTAIRFESTGPNNIFNELCRKRVIIFGMNDLHGVQGQYKVFTSTSSLLKLNSLDADIVKRSFNDNIKPIIELLLKFKLPANAISEKGMAINY